MGPQEELLTGLAGISVKENRHRSLSPIVKRKGGLPQNTLVQSSNPVDILILSNGPGEVTTWVRPVVRSLRSLLGNDREQVRISVVLSPCVNATGQEAEIVRSYPEVDRVQDPEDFHRFLLWGKTAADWDWHPRGVVLFLGGDQFFPVVIGRRLGYRTVVYAERTVRWPAWIDRFGILQPQVQGRLPARYAHKLSVVGDLMVEAAAMAEPSAALAEFLHRQPRSELIGLLPGSKAAKLSQGVPLVLAIAEAIHAQRPQTRFVIPVAPTLTPAALARYADPGQNPVLARVGGIAATLSAEGEQPYLKTVNGLRIDLWTPAPAYDLLARCRLCFTTVGANTAELGALAVPMLVLVPTQQLDAMRAWDGLPGLLANLPGVGSGIARLINWMMLRRLGLLAWPNVWAGRRIVPELVGKLQPSAVAAIALDLLEHPEALEQIQADLRRVRGQPGAATALAELVQAELATLTLSR